MATEIIMPKLGLTMKEGNVDYWLVKEGDYVNKGDPLVEISSEKLTNEVESPVSGTILKITVQEGDSIPSQAVMAYIGEEGEEIDLLSEEVEEDLTESADTSDTLQEVQLKKEQADEEDDRVFITPVARKIAEKHGINIDDVDGTGGNKRITRLDIERYIETVEKSVPPRKDILEVAEEYGAGLEGMRKVIATRMMQSIQTTAQVTNQRKVDITELMQFRKDIKDKTDYPFDQGELSVNTLITKAVVMALGDYPEMNAWYHEDQYIQVEEIHIGIATSLEEGLVVPVIKNAEKMPLSQLGSAIKKVTTEARDGTLDNELYSGSTFSITNLGILEIEYFTPIINPPEVAILGVGALQKELIFDKNNEIVERSKLPLSLTYDHQIIDGAVAAEFLIKIQEYLEDPYRLLI